MTAKEVWALVPKGDVAAATRALEAGATGLVSEDTKDLQGLSSVPVHQRKDDALVSDDTTLPLITITQPEDQEIARKALEDHGTIVVDPRDWAIIPEENLVAWANETGGRVLVLTEGVENALTALRALERGVDGVIVPADQVKPIVDELRATPTMDLVEAEVVEVRSIGMGDRVCVDTCSLLEPDEGLLVGSQASHLFLVVSENHESGYVSSRPFRVNAGAVHQYVLGPDGRTRYLSEAQGGQEVLTVDRQGGTRRAIIGRAKVEHRPLLLLRARTPDGHDAQTILQDAETIRVGTPDGSISIAELEPGAKVLVHEAPGARHFGVAIEERVVER